jgi:hypothetical protein
MQISQADFYERAKKLYGDDPQGWKFHCCGCKNIQSGAQIIEQAKKGIKFMRHGELYEGDVLRPHSECYSPSCNWVAYGLFSSGILVIIDPTKPHNENLKQNCYYIFPLADDKEMLEAAGIDLKREALEARLTECGYKLVKIVSFKRFDRVVVVDSEGVKASYPLNGKFADLDVEKVANRLTNKEAP